MHRLDISRATGIPVQAAPEHEGIIVDDIVREWAARHGRPYTLSLSGPAGGTWGGEGEHITMDAFRLLPDGIRPGTGDRAAQPAGALLGRADAAPGTSGPVLVQSTADSHRPGS
jgi:hypothetical protein